MPPLHIERIKGYDYWEKRKPGGATATVIGTDGILEEQDTNGTQFILEEKDAGAGTDRILEEQSP